MDKVKLWLGITGAVVTVGSCIIFALTKNLLLFIPMALGIIAICIVVFQAPKP